ncbi:MAG TPA: anthranilate phosphoribosyltransferase, partial [Anaerolineales bacterium]|nr:anthranilate phosphoribosyltransferase [Anaerolineales bacterium]
GSAEENLELMRGVLAGKMDGVRQDTVLLNAAATIATENGDMRTALQEARAALESGTALKKLEALVERSQQLSAQQ